MTEVTLRPFQERALSQYRLSYPQANAHLGIAPTAFGKTIFMGWIAKAVVGSADKFRCVCIAHREALVTNNAAKVSMVAPWLKVGIEQAQSRADLNCDFISASIATLRGDRLQKFVEGVRADGRPVFLFIDEAHHATADSYRTLIEALKPEKHLGLTATPFRADDSSLADIYPLTGFEIPRSEMIDDGWLASPRHFLIKTSVSLEGIKKSRGDYNEKELAKRLDVFSRNELILNAADEAADYIRAEQGTTARAVCFCLSVAHAIEMATLFAERGWDAMAIHGETPIAERREGDEMLKAGTRNSILLNYGVLTEGWDVEEVNLGIFARPTKSPVLADQMLGRVLRFHTDKPWSICIDFGDKDADDRCSIAGSFKLPTEWDALGECLRENEKWFQERLKKASYVARAELWHCQTKDQVEAVLAQLKDNFEAALIPDRPYMWWDCHTEIRMVIGACCLVIRQTNMGDFAAEYRFGPEIIPIIRAESLRSVFDESEEWFANNMGDMEPFLRNYPDRGDPVTDKQVSFLERNGHRREEILQLTKRQAGFLISRVFMEIAKNAEEGMVCFGKHQGKHVSEVPAGYIEFMLDNHERVEWMEKARRPELPWFRMERERRVYG